MEKNALPKTINYSRLDVFNEDFSGFSDFTPSCLFEVPQTVNDLAIPKIPRCPLFLYLPRTKPDYSPKLNNLETEVLNKKKVRYLNYYVISTSFFAYYQEDTQHKAHKKLQSSLKNVKVCKEFYSFNYDRIFSKKEFLKLRRSSHYFRKTLQYIACEGPFYSLFSGALIYSLNVDSQKIKFAGASLKNLKMKRAFQSDQDNHKMLNYFNRLRKIENIYIQIEDYRKILKNQVLLSKTLKKLKTLKVFNLGLTFLVEREDLFDKEESEEEVEVDLLLWNKITGLHISDDDIPLDRIMDKVGHFRALTQFSYYGEPKFREDFSSFSHLSQLTLLKKIDISISMLGTFGSGGADFFESEFLPPSLEELTLRVEMQRLTSVLEKVISRGTLFAKFNKLTSLKYFLLSIGREGEVFSQTDHQFLCIFLKKILENISQNLESFILIVSGFQKTLIKEETFSVTEENLLTIISHKLQSLKSLFLKFLLINHKIDLLNSHRFSKLEILNFEGSLPQTLIQLLDTNILKEFYCQCLKKISIKDFISFIRDVTKFKILRVLNIRMKSFFIQNNTDFTQVNHDLFAGIVDLFRHLKQLNDLSLGLAPITIQKKIALYIFDLCNLKKRLRFCSMEFDNCQIIKEYFSTSLMEEYFSSDDEDEEIHSYTRSYHE